MGFDPQYAISQRISRELVRIEAVREKMEESAEIGDRSDGIRSLDARQRKVLALFEEWDEITTSQIAELLKLSPRGARAQVQKWVHNRFLVVANASKRARTYRLAYP